MLSCKNQAIESLAPSVHFGARHPELGEKWVYNCHSHLPLHTVLLCEHVFFFLAASHAGWFCIFSFWACSWGACVCMHFFAGKVASTHHFVCLCGAHVPVWRTCACVALAMEHRWPGAGARSPTCLWGQRIWDFPGVWQQGQWANALAGDSAAAVAPARVCPVNRGDPTAVVKVWWLKWGGPLCKTISGVSPSTFDLGWEELLGVLVSHYTDIWVVASGNKPARNLAELWVVCRWTHKFSLASWTWLEIGLVTPLCMFPADLSLLCVSVPDRNSAVEFGTRLSDGESVLRKSSTYRIDMFPIELSWFWWM